ncbi:D-alanine--D-alanine ligase [Pseudomonas sp. F1_0610]|uniref:D-alanine--D-alanine ligase n=1 Tax=Pseudomonas sp. F1_0610 TaxID=3114284 RepID=UPI0039C39E62
MAKIHVGIVFGGKSTEHEVSLQSAKNIIQAIDKKRFEISLFGVDKTGQWQLMDAANFLLNENDPSLIALNHSHQTLSLPLSQAQQISVETAGQSQLKNVDVIFPIVHGHLGEDGALQGLLRSVNIPFVGTHILGSAICMDKDITKRLLRDAGLNIAPFITLKRSDYAHCSFEKIKTELGLPFFIKPANLGSSVGVSKVDNQQEFAKAMKLAFEFDHKVLVETTIVGREIECAVLGNDYPQASICGEIIVADQFYAYETKYISSGAAKIVIPAAISSRVQEKIQHIAIKAYKVLECLGMARVDIFLTQNEQVIINEVNTLPGFTNISMYPKLWEASGLSYSDLITKLIELALQRHRQDSALLNTVVA